MQPNRVGLGLRPSMPSFGQGPTMGALAQMQFAPPQLHKQTTLFVGSISGGIQDDFLNQLLKVCNSLSLCFTELCRPVDPSGRSNDL